MKYCPDKFCQNGACEYHKGALETSVSGSNGKLSETHDCPKCLGTIEGLGGPEGWCKCPQTSPTKPSGWEQKAVSYCSQRGLTYTDQDKLFELIHLIFRDKAEEIENLVNVYKCEDKTEDVYRAIEDAVRIIEA